VSIDARFEDGRDRPIKLKAVDSSDLKVISSLVQDSVVPKSEISWRSKEHRFALLINRFRWEDNLNLTDSERVQSLLIFDDVMKVSSKGINQENGAGVFSLLTVFWQDLKDASGRFELVFSGKSVFDRNFSYFFQLPLMKFQKNNYKVLTISIIYNFINLSIIYLILLLGNPYLVILSVILSIIKIIFFIRYK